MKDIRTAIEKEEEYLRRKVGRGDNTANIYDYIIFGGYDNLIEFYSDRAEYLLRDLYYQVVEEPYIGMKSLLRLSARIPQRSCTR